MRFKHTMRANRPQVVMLSHCIGPDVLLGWAVCLGKGLKLLSVFYLLNPPEFYILSFALRSVGTFSRAVWSSLWLLVSTTSPLCVKFCYGDYLSSMFLGRDEYESFLPLVSGESVWLLVN